MNRYAAAGLLAEVRDGKRILVVTPDRQVIRDALEEFEDLLVDGERVLFANGMERVEDRRSGGRLFFHSLRSIKGGAGRAFELDGVYVDRQAVAGWNGDIELLAEVMPALYVTGGQVVLA